MNIVPKFIPRRHVPRPASFGFTAVLARGLCDALAVASALWLCWLLYSHHAIRLSWNVGLLVARAIFFASAFIAVHEWQHWAQPARELQQSLSRIRDGQVSIDDAGAIGGGLQPLADELQQVLRQLRAQRAQITALEQEMGHRVAQRTDALQRVVGSLRLQMSRDPLTGLHNRRSLDDCLEQLMQDACDNDSPLCLLMIDIDDFKILNDTLGHVAGDDLLRSLGQLIRCNLRSGDLAFRYGGDEFVLVLPNTTRRQAEVLSQRLISLVDALAKTLHVLRPPRLSVGLAMPCDLGPYPTPTALLHEADKQLYALKTRHKTEGRKNVNGRNAQPLSA